MIHRAYILMLALICVAAYLALPHTPDAVTGPNPLVGLLLIVPVMGLWWAAGRREA